MNEKSTDMGSFYTRMDRMAEYYGVKTGDLVKRCGVPYATFRSSRLRRSNPQMKSIACVLRTCPEIDARWLILGTGEMLVPAKEDQTLATKQDSEEVARLKAQVEKLTALVLEKERRIIALETRSDG